MVEDTELLQALGLRNAYVVYDSDFVHLDKVVPAGYPIDLGYDSPEYREAVNRLLTKGGRVIVEVRGSSMIGAGIESGDSVELSLQCTAEDGDIVVASLDGCETVKIYCEDEYGERWLVPDNDEFEPIRMSASDNVRILGKVIRIIKGNMPRGNMRYVMKRIAAARKGVDIMKPTGKRLAAALRLALDIIRVNRQWYSVFNVLYQREMFRL